MGTNNNVPVVVKGEPTLRQNATVTLLPVAARHIKAHIALGPFVYCHVFSDDTHTFFLDPLCLGFVVRVLLFMLSNHVIQLILRGDTYMPLCAPRFLKMCLLSTTPMGGTQKN